MHAGCTRGAARAITVHPDCRLQVQAHLTLCSTPPSVCVTSLDGNDLTDSGKDMSGIVKLAEWMKKKPSLKQLKCAPQTSKKPEGPPRAASAR